MAIADEIIAETQHLEARANAGSEDFPIFWSRGVVPKSWLNIPPPADQERRHFYGDLAWWIFSEIFFTDCLNLSLNCSIRILMEELKFDFSNWNSNGTMLTSV